MDNIVIRVEHLSKMYRLGVINNGTLFKDIQTWIALKRGKEDPHSKIGENKYNNDKDHYWALKDISIDIKQGDRVGIIGKNGAGKSTLLKVLSRITAPTEGAIKVRGKIASLLEVGTGFHAELTGRENIYLNGAILGMKKRRIDQKLDEIIAFSGIEHHIDTPVKRYSSGMYVRLAFAVAAHLDSDILIADEVLAVGDAEFQKKALGKMRDLSSGQGRTVLFVSHNMGAVNGLCNRGILLREGLAVFSGSINDTIAQYSIENTVGIENSISDLIAKLPHDPAIKILNIRMIQNNTNVISEVYNGSPLEIEITYKVLEREMGLRVFVDICDTMNELICRTFHDENNIGVPILEKGLYKSKVTIPENFLGPTKYKIIIQATVHAIRYCTGDDGIIIPINVINTGIYNKAYPHDIFWGKLGMVFNWGTQKDS